MGYAAGRGVTVGGSSLAVKSCRRDGSVQLLGAEGGHEERSNSGVIKWY